MAVVSLGQAVVAHLTRVYRRSYGMPMDRLAPLLGWVNDHASTQPALRLPLLSCEAAGGDPIRAIPVSAAWHLLHCAAHLLDDVVDEAPLSLETGQAVNAAVTLIFLAQVSLTTLCTTIVSCASESAVEAERVVALVHTFNTATARMAEGQGADLAWDEETATLDDYWRVAGAKTGEFFALACRAGAMLGTDDQTEIDLYATFGYHLGMLVQLGDDLQALWRPRGRDDLITASRTLPVVYALTVAPPETRTHLRALLRRALEDPVALRELQAHLADHPLAEGEPMGALHYLTLQACWQHHLARKALLSSTQPTVGQHELIQLLDSAFPAVARRQLAAGRGGSDRTVKAQ